MRLYCVPLIETLDQMKIRLFEDGVPVASTISLSEGYYKAAGLLMACSIVHGGPAPNFMAQWVFDYIAHGLHQVPLGIDDIQNKLPKKVAEKVQCNPLYLGLNIVAVIAIDKEQNSDESLRQNISISNVL